MLVHGHPKKPREFVVNVHRGQVRRGCIGEGLLVGVRNEQPHVGGISLRGPNLGACHEVHYCASILTRAHSRRSHIGPTQQYTGVSGRLSRSVCFRRGSGSGIRTPSCPVTLVVVLETRAVDIVAVVVTLCDALTQLTLSTIVVRVDCPTCSLQRVVKDSSLWPPRAVRQWGRVLGARPWNARAFVVLVASIAVAGLGACHAADITNPTTQKPLAADPSARFGGFSTDAGFGSLNSPSSGSYSGSTNAWDASADPQSLGTFHFGTIVMVTTSGTVQQVPGILPGDGLTYGPEGTGSFYHQAQLALLTDYGFAYLSGGTSSVYIPPGNLRGLRTGLLDPQPRGEPWWTCGSQIPNHASPCWTFSGPSNITFTDIPVALTLTRSDSGRLKDSTMVTFTAGMDKETIGDHYIDMSMLQWRWETDPPMSFGTDAAAAARDSAAAAADTITCTAVVDRICRHEMLRSGIVYSTAYVNGVQQERKFHMDVKRKPSIELALSRDSVNAGDTVFVTTTVRDADKDSLLAYTYSESGPIMAFRGGGTAPAMSTTRIATRRSARSTAPSAPRFSASVSGTPCLTSTPSPKQCFIIPTATGTLVVTALADDEQLSAEKPIKVAGPTFAVVCDPKAQVRAATVTCTAAMSDGSQFTPTRLQSSVDGQSVADVVPPAASTARYEWAGEAIAATQVTVTATSQGRNVEAKASFDVQTRVGADTLWKRPSFPAEAPAAIRVGGTPLTSTYPGIVPTNDGYTADEGSLGITIFEYPYPRLRRAMSGPDQGLAYILIPNWLPDKRSGVSVKGIYVERSLMSSDPFYLRQTGPDPKDKQQTPYCGRTEMAALSSLLDRHEALHWTTAQPTASPIQISWQDWMERFYSLPAVSTADITSTIQATYKPYAAAITAANNVVETSLPVEGNAPACVMRP